MEVCQPMSSEPHYFIAIPLHPSLQEQLSSWQNDLKGKLTYKNWPHKQDLHITLKFLGPVADNKIDQVKEALTIVEGLREFSIDAGSIGTFGKPEHPRVLWAGVSKTKGLTALQQKIDEATADIGFQKETREFHPHITLAKKWLGEPAKNTLKEVKRQYIDKQQMAVGKLVLYKIHPTKTIKYEVVQTYKLKGGE